MLEKKVFFIFALLMSLILLVACGDPASSEPLPDPDEPVSSDQPADLVVDDPAPAGGSGAASGSQIVGAGLIGEWLLVSLNGHSLVEGSTITANFDGLQVNGVACNNYFGSYTVEADSISFGDIGSTDMYCEKTMDQETEYLNALFEITSWRITGATLELAGGKAILVFERVAPTTDAQLEGATWMLESFIIGGDAVSSLIAGTSISATFDDGTISGNASCNEYSGAVSIDGAGISIGKLAQTKMACQTGMEQENQYLQTLREVSTWQIEGDRLTLSADNGNGLIFRAQ